MGTQARKQQDSVTAVPLRPQMSRETWLKTCFWIPRISSVADNRADRGREANEMRIVNLVFDL